MEEQSYWVNVPQGRGARLIRDVDWLNIQGLYSDQFSICSLITAIGKNRISLIHLDKQFSLHNSAHDAQVMLRLSSVLAELDWVKQDDPACRIVIIHKAGTLYPGMKIGDAQYIAESYQKHFKTHQFDVELCCVKDSQLGITVNFTDGLQPHSDYPSPQNLLCHPDELKFNTAHQIEDVFYHLKLGDSVRKTLTIFDGLFWQPLTEQDKKPQFESKIPQPFLDRITPAMTTLDMQIIFNKKYKVSLSGKETTVIFPSNTALLIGPYISLYKNDHKLSESFNFNIDKLILELDKNVKKVKGHSTKAVIWAALKNPTTAVQSLKPALNDIVGIDNSDSTQTHCKYLYSWATFYSKLVNKYAKALQYPEWQQRAQKMMASGTKHLQQKQYQAAANIYQSCLPLLAYTYTEENENLFSVTMNLGKCYYQLQNFPSALRFLNIALELTKKHQQNPEQMLQLLKLIDQCKQEIQSDKSVHAGLDQQLPKGPA